MFCICEFDIAKLVKMNQLDSREDINKNVSFLLAYPLYSMRSDQTAENSEFNIFISEKMKDMTEIRRAMINSAAQSVVSGL